MTPATNGAAASSTAAAHASALTRLKWGRGPVRVLPSSSARALHRCSAPAAAAMTSSAASIPRPSTVMWSPSASCTAGRNEATIAQAMPASSAIAIDRSCAQPWAIASSTARPTASAVSAPRENVR